ncbi:hypothetical protein CY652_03295 [Burkholderia sp. WAC0059]|nr:hypothetical protein CY652_03295 [Burkholderia sp. WAC0059]
MTINWSRKHDACFAVPEQRIAANERFVLATEGKGNSRSWRLVPGDGTFGWHYPKHLAWRVYDAIVHGDVACVEVMRRTRADCIVPAKTRAASEKRQVRRRKRRVWTAQAGRAACVRQSVHDSGEEAACCIPAFPARATTARCPGGAARPV